MQPRNASRQQTLIRAKTVNVVEEVSSSSTYVMSAVTLVKSIVLFVWCIYNERFYRDAMEDLRCIRCNAEFVSYKCACGCYSAYYVKRVSRSIRAR